MSLTEARAEHWEEIKENAKYKRQIRRAQSYEEDDENKRAKERRGSDKKDEKNIEAKLSQKDPTLPAQLHGHKPSKGAMIDKELKDEEAEIIAKKTQEGKGMAGEKR